MKKFFLLVLILFTGLAASHDYIKESFRCSEVTLCHEPEEYSEYDLQRYIDEVSIKGDLWNGTIKIHDVEFTHNFSEEISNMSFGRVNKSSEGARNTRVKFDGIIRVESPCNQPMFDLDIYKSSRYTLNLHGNDTYSVRNCIDHPTKVDYTMTLDTSTSNMELIVNQTNSTEKFQTENFQGLARRAPKDVPEPEEQEKEGRPEDEEGLFSGLTGFLTGLF